MKKELTKFFKALEASAVKPSESQLMGIAGDAMKLVATLNERQEKGEPITDEELLTLPADLRIGALSLVLASLLQQASAKLS